MAHWALVMPASPSFYSQPRNFDDLADSVVWRILDQIGAKLSMMETVIRLKPQSQWRKIKTWYSDLPRWIQSLGRHITPDHRVIILPTGEVLPNEPDQAVD